MGYSRQRKGTAGELRFTAYYWDIRGRERSAGTFASLVEADRAWQLAETSVGQGRFADIHSGRQAFRRYVLETWLPGHMIEAYTRQGYTQTVEKYLLPEFGRMRMNEVLPMHVRDFIRRLCEEGASPHTVQRCKTVLSAIFTTAMSDRVVHLHPCVGVRAPVVPKRPPTLLTPRELDAVLDVVEELRWRLLIETAIETGLRWGELAELRVADLDIDAAVVTVTRTVLELRPQFHPTGDRFLIKMYPKSREYRRLSIRRVLADRLAAFIHTERLGPEDLLFEIPEELRLPVRPVPRDREVGELTVVNEAGRRYRHGTVYGYSIGRCRCQHCRGAYADYRAQRRADGKDRPAKAGRLDTDGHVSRRWFRDTIWKPALAAAGITRRVRIHDLRHAHASWLLAGGADVQTVRERLGHASLRATERYLHTLPGSDQHALRAFTRIRDGRSTMTCRPSVRVVRVPSGRARVLRRRTAWA